MEIIEQDMQSISEIRKVYTFVQTGARINDVGGGGDMTKAVYDPNAVAGDAFDMSNMAESATAKILTAVERTGPTQVEAETGTSAVTKLWSALRVRQAIVSWAATAASIFSGNLSGYTEDSGPITITAGAGAIDMATTKNIRPVALVQNTVITVSNLVAYKAITLPITQAGVPSTLTLLYGDAYIAATPYAKHAIVQEAGISYISLVDANTGNTPASSPVQWKPVGAILLNAATDEQLETVELWCDGTRIFVPTDGGVLWTVGV